MTNLAPEPNADELDSLRQYFTDTIAQYTDAPRIPELGAKLARYVKARDRTRALAILEELEKEEPQTFTASEMNGMDAKSICGAKMWNFCNEEWRTAIAHLKDKYGGRVESK